MKFVCSRELDCWACSVVFVCFVVFVIFRTSTLCASLLLRSENYLKSRKVRAKEEDTPGGRERKRNKISSGYWIRSQCSMLNRKEKKLNSIHPDIDWTVDKRLDNTQYTVELRINCDSEELASVQLEISALMISRHRLNGRAKHSADDDDDVSSETLNSATIFCLFLTSPSDN